MIQRLNASSISFQSASPREAYENQMTRNFQTAQKQSNMVSNMTPAVVNGQITMQGTNTTGQKLDVIA